MKIGRTRTLQSAKYLEKKRKRLVVTISLISFIFLICVLLLVLFLRLPFLQVKSVIVNGSTTVSATGIQDTVMKNLQGNYLFFIPKSNFLFYPKNRITKDILSSYNKLSDSSLELDGIDRLTVSVAERIPAVTVCEGYRDDEAENLCYFADSSGYVYEKIEGFYDDVYFRYYLNTSSTTVSLGSPFIDPSRFSKLQSFISDLNNTIVKSNGLLIGDDGSYELYIENKDGSAGVVYFDDRIPLETTKTNLVVFWQNALNKKIGLSYMPSFEYINLRFGRNIFYLVKTDNAKQE